MDILHVNNVNDGLSEALHFLEAQGVPEDSRNGKVLVAPGPVCTVYAFPCERVLFSPLRDANPFFHMMEALWMLNGGFDIKWPAYFNKQMMSYSDDGVTQHGAYGRRWRSWFGYDQLPIIINELKKNPQSRRCVLTMWDATRSDDEYGLDLCLNSDIDVAVNGGKDVPCNTHIYFDVRDKKLNMTVCCRSNDIFWGTFGANAVHFSFLQEYVATAVGVPVGLYRQFSNNFHAYTDVFPQDKWGEIAADAEDHDLYAQNEFQPTPLIYTDIETWTTELARFINNPLDPAHYTDSFFRDTAFPMYMAWHERKLKVGNGLHWAEAIKAPDWNFACCNWIARRELKKEKSA